MRLDEILRKIRKELNISQEQFARDLNVSFTTLNRWENSRTTPSRLAKMRIIDYCNEKGISKEIIAALEQA
ncbi:MULTISPECIES: helix-turn-helix domain-containing protein [Caproicibacterium]|jgi:DNA-binding transcriptional regulator YiaG|uniref:Helix-turn-helix transcriptional regulator n=1 Tax=Caproicibacterium argilliputei TaxID=3030016 RepID=A0AA97D7N7_9FIRM|nr:helix-turn-helix transcriptional regulator [Caproicibacterium argilliputei]WOC32075.1 helix-turn-helix transcriptional regulator [Caproicibacterium argilliputei]HCS75133.1 transcriptional regulator [Clostridiales bacterium]